MTNTNQSHKRSKWIRIPAWILLSLVVLIGGLRLFLTTPLAQNWARKGLLAFAGPYVNGELKIDRLEGDLWKTMRLRKVAISDSAGNPVASLDSLRLDYSLPSLLGNSFQIRRLNLASPRLTLKRNAAGHWNIENLIRLPDDPDTARSTFYFNIDSLALSGGAADIYPSVRSTDSSYHMSEFNIRATAGYHRRGYSVMLGELRFLATTPAFADTLQLMSSGQYQQQAFSLEKLVISTGQSIFSTRGEYHTGKGKFELNSLLQPLSVQDLRSISDLPVRQNLDVNLSFEGTLSRFRTNLSLQAPAVEKFELGAGFKWDSLLALTELQTDLRNFNGPELVDADSLHLPQIDSFGGSLKGYVPIQKWRSGTLSGHLEGSGIGYDRYEISRIKSDLRYQNYQTTLKTTINRGRERVNLTAKALMSPSESGSPEWSLDYSIRNGNPGYWMGPEGPAGVLNLDGSMSGVGWMPGVKDWRFNLRLFESRIASQPVKRTELRGTINRSRLSVRTTLELERSSLTGTATVGNYRGVPRYTFDLRSDDFNLADIKQLQGNESHIKMHIHGEGEGMSPETLSLTSDISLDSSSVNEATIRELHGHVEVQDTIMKVSDAEIKSEIADGYFSARQHLVRFYDRNNSLDLNLEVKNLQPLASFVDAERLEAGGTIRGNIRPYGQEMQFDGSLRLRHLAYDDLVNVDSIRGSLQLELKRNPYYHLEFDVDRPTVSGVVLQDFNLQSDGYVDWEESKGSVAVNLSSGTGAELSQRGTFIIRPDSVNLTTRKLDLQTPARNLSLQAPFGFHYRSGVFSMDTLRLVSAQQFHLEAAISRIDTLHQEGYLRANRINLKALQEVLLGRHAVGGYLTGSLNLNKEGSDIDMDTDLRMHEFSYENVNLDTVRLDVLIRENRFNASANVIHQGKPVVRSGVELPFRLGDPKSFPPSFFEQEVQGYLRVSPMRLNEIKGTGELLGFEKTDGTVRARGVLRGTAGMPHISGYASMSNGQWSGVPIDSATVQMAYQHKEEKLSLVSDIISLGQKAVSFNAELPLQVDMRTWKVNVPRDSETLKLTAVTNQFNLSALNEFVDRNYMRDLKGRLDGDVTLTGSIEEPRVDGSLQLSKAGVMLPQAGVTYGEMNGKMVFEKNEVSLKEFSAKSGGDLGAQGTLEFDGYMPADMDLQLTARNFKAADTRQFQFIVNSTSRLQGNISNPRVSGDLSIRRGFFNLPEFGEKSVEKVKLKSEKGAGDEGFTPYDSLNISMNLSVSPEFTIRNKRYANMEVGLEGSVDVLKEKGGELQLFGTINGRSGYIRTLGKRFTMEDARLQFAGNPENPQLQMRFLHKPPQPKENIRIYYVIGGTMEEPEFSYDSDPPMELENIISYTLFGQPYYALDSWKQVVARPDGGGSMATNLMTEAILNRVETLATGKLGVDVVQIENNQSGSGGGTSIKTGWYLNERTFLAILNTISGSRPTTTFILEYMLRKNLELILTQGSDSREGIDLHWQKDY